MSEYEAVRKGKLKLKGEPEKSKKRKHKKDKKEKSEKSEKPEVIVDQDAIDHGGWWRVKLISEITGSVAIQFDVARFVKSVDDGTFTIGAKHQKGEAPSFDEEFSAFTINDSKVCFKSGYGKYLKVEKDGVITGRTEAVGASEQFEPVFQEGKMALQAANGCFLSIDAEDDTLVAVRKNVGDDEVCIIRSNAFRGEVISSNAPIEEKNEDLNQVELSYVKKFQKYQDKKIKICQDDKLELKQAKESGKLHEGLLDRRSKMKSDRYCK